ncbi:MAG: hypothetical protein RLZZ272_1410 [Actinomycetota bacterium]
MNRLSGSSSPYLRQHANNPVEWFEWGSEAFQAARERDVPIFLSVGYSSCHWCHVMAHESFEDETVAEVLNARFVNIKVDREERPDVDAVHMRVVQAMTGRGGWPMSVFLTPDGEPFHGGTYWPREPRHGMPGFLQVASAVADAWRDRRDEVTGSASAIAEALARATEAEPIEAIDLTVVDDAATVLLTRAWDRELGGFGRAPKFPQAMTITWLLARHRRTREDAPLAAAVQALDAMARGGIHDLIGGGFARYSTDARWLVPHFEKMLYDNALLLDAYAEAAAITGDVRLAATATAIAEALLAPVAEGGFTVADGPLAGTFVAAFDADAAGVEGSTFVWSRAELVEVAAVADPAGGGERWADFLGVTAAGNWEGTNVPHEPIDRREVARGWGVDDAEFERRWQDVRTALLARRRTRVQPGVDDKVLVDWNALAVRALVRAGRRLARPDWVAAAARAAEVLHGRGTVGGRLRHVVDGAPVDAFLDDLANLALADVELLAATGERRWHARALALVADVEARFADPAGGWFDTAADAERLIARPKSGSDNATPAGTAVMVEVLLRLHQTTGGAGFRARAEDGIRAIGGGIASAPPGYGTLLRLLEWLTAGLEEVVVVGPAGPERDTLERIALQRSGPGALVVVADAAVVAADDAVPLLAGRAPIDGRPTAFRCVGMVCELPTTEPDVLATQLAA